MNTVPHGYYVYELLDPQGAVFYVGKGKGRRMYAHERDARRGCISNLAKHARISDIHRSGRQVHYRIVADDLTEADAYQLEARTIRKHGHANLTNATSGWASDADKARAMAAYLYQRIIPFPIWHAIAPRTDADCDLYWDVRRGLLRESAPA